MSGSLLLGEDATVRKSEKDFEKNHPVELTKPNTVELVGRDNQGPFLVSLVGELRPYKES